MNELNPNHPVTREMREQWHKLCALAMFKLGAPEVDITSADIAEFEAALGAGASITVHPKDDVLELRLVNGAEAARLAREHGGLPI